MEFSRPEYWKGSRSPLQGIFPTQGSNPLDSWWVGGFFTNWATREAHVKLFPLDFAPGTFCVLGECDNHHTTETSTLISRWYYTHIYLHHHFSQVSGGVADRRSFAFLKIVAQHHQHLLSFLLSHGKIITFRTKINDLIINIWFFFLKKDHWEWVYLKGWTPSYIISVNIFLQFVCIAWWL